MKKTIGMLLITVFVCMLCGCTRANESGKVTYQLGTSKLKLSESEDMKRWGKIEGIYTKYLEAIEEPLLTEAQAVPSRWKVSIRRPTQPS